MVFDKLSNCSHLHILVVGDVMLDRYWYGDTSRVSPEAPVPVVKVQQCEDRPGGAANVALNIRALGAQATILGIVGEDEAAETLISQLEGVGVHHCFARIPNLPTVTKLRVLSRHQQLLRMDFEENHPKIPSDILWQQFNEALTTADAVVFSDYNKGALVNIQAMIQAANKSGLPVFVDPKCPDLSLYRGATVVKPNLLEFQAMVGGCDSEQSIVSKGQKLLRQYQLQALLVTRGECGMTLLREDQPELHLPARAKEVFDVTGAGDTVIAVLAIAVAAGISLTEAMPLANAAAGVAVSKLGAATISVPELRRASQQHMGGVMTAEQLLIIRQDAQAHGEKVVMTNGCFDLIHPGHIHYLEQARALGDRLIVAVNSDHSVQQLKGKGRPLNTVEKRMAVLSGLSAVDWVVCFDEQTPQQLISTILPDILVKGGDYKKQTIAGGEAVLAHGGEVKILDFVEGCSTTELLEQINAAERGK